MTSQRQRGLQSIYSESEWIAMNLKIENILWKQISTLYVTFKWFDFL